MFTLSTSRYAALLGAVALVAVYASAAISQAKESGAPPPGKKMREVNVASDFARQKRVTEGLVDTLRGNVVIKSDATVLTTDLAMYNEDTGVATSPGKLKVQEPDNTLTGNTGTAYYKTRDVKIRDAVVLEIRPRAKDRNAEKGSSRSKFKDPVTITCAKLDYNWKTKIAELTGDLTFKQKDRTVTADRAVYNGKTETLTLLGNVEYTTVKGDKAFGEKAVAVLRDGDEDFQWFKLNNSKLYFEDEEETETPAKPSASETTAPEPTTPPATAPATPVTAPAPNNPTTPTTPGTSPATTPAPNPVNPPATPGGTPAGEGRL